MSTMVTPPPPPSWAPPSPADLDGAAPKRSNRTAKVVGTLAVLGAVGGALTMSSLALFTDSEDVDNNVFSTGVVDIATSPTTAAFSPGVMAPGDEVVAPILVRNDGSLELRYAVTSTTTEDVLAAQLLLTVRVGVTDCSVANWDASGTEIAAADILGSTTGEPVFGDVAQGAQAGDRVLVPAPGPGDQETLCLHVELPITSGNAYEGLSTTATFSFVAEQTKNN